MNKTTHQLNVSISPEAADQFDWLVVNTQPRPTRRSLMEQIIADRFRAAAAVAEAAKPRKRRK